jgi:multicomponent Na+:H+ antiporter subunit E
MSYFLWNVLLAFVWATMTGQFTLGNVVVGFLLGYGILFLSQRVVGPSRYFLRVRQLVGFALYYLRELVSANLRVARDVVTPTYAMRPAIVAIPLDARTDIEITLLSSLIALTPGSLGLDVSDDRSVLYVHGMFVDDPEAFCRGIKEGLERPLLELLR